MFTCRTWTLLNLWSDKGEKPRFISFEQEKETIGLLEAELDKVQDHGLKSVAILTKTMKEAKKLYKQVKDSDRDYQLLEESENITQGKIAILPSYLAKGLEFDAVLLMNFDEVYTDNEIDIKLLYVAMTRPLHHLSMIGRKKDSFLLNKLHPRLFDVH